MLLCHRVGDFPLGIWMPLRLRGHRQ
jgi:hypothetical protein